ETEAVGAGLAERLAPGDVVVGSGEGGAGKTTLIRRAARAPRVTAPGPPPTPRARAPPARWRPPADLPPRPLPARGHGGRGPGADRRLPRRRRRRLRRVARGRHRGTRSPRPRG